MFGKLLGKFLAIVFFMSIVSTHLMAIDNCKLEGVNLSELKEQTMSVLKSRLLELEQSIFTRKNELMNQQGASFVDTSVDSDKELVELEKSYTKLKSEISNLDSVFDESQDTSLLNLNQFFSTHPSTKKRIAKLKELDNTYREKLIKEVEIYG